jgi:hypothetical protein
VAAARFWQRRARTNASLEETMAAEDVTRWLGEKKPQANVNYLGPDADGVHGWRLEFREDAPGFELRIPEELLDSAGMLAERLMELETQGHLDVAGEEEYVVYLTPMEIAREPGLWE